jgi:hypothetical protein
MLITLTVDGWCVAASSFPSCHRRSSNQNLLQTIGCHSATQKTHAPRALNVVALSGSSTSQRPAAVTPVSWRIRCADSTLGGYHILDSKSNLSGTLAWGVPPLSQLIGSISTLSDTASGMCQTHVLEKHRVRLAVKQADFKPNSEA